MIQVGDKLPDVSFQRLTENGVVTLSSKEIFSGETIVLFALPGAFTPTCSATHLPGFVALAEQFFQQGVDRLACAFDGGGHGRVDHVHVVRGHHTGQCEPERPGRSQAVAAGQCLRQAR